MNAKQRIELKQDRARYKKVGRKYVLCNDFDAYEGLEDGWWLVKVAPSCKTIRACVYPAKAELMAAIKDKEDQIIEVIRKASECRPRNIPLSQEELEDWRSFIKKYPHWNMLEYPSFSENAEEILKILVG